MATKKQIFIPIVVLAVGAAAMAGFSALRKPPEEKKDVDLTPIVAVQEVSLQNVNLDVKSHGIVQPKYETEMVAQVSGQITTLSEDFVRGGFIKKGQVLATIDDSDYIAALIEAEANHASAIASLELEKAQGKVAEKEWQRIKDSSPTELSLRKPQLAQEMARVKASEAAIRRAKRNLERTKITAPYDAMIANRTVGLGSFVTVGTKLGKLLNVAVAKVRLPVADNELQFLLENGDNALVTLTSEYSGKTQTWQATIARNEGVIDDSSRMNYLVAEIEDPYGLRSGDKAIKYGTYVNALITGASLEKAILVPRHLVNDNKIAVLNDDLTLSYRDINIVRQQGKKVVVSDGLEGGDRIITSALDFPISGMQLAITQGSKAEPKQPELKSEAETQIANKGQ